MKEYRTKGLITILAVALVLGLATSAFAAGNWSFGAKGGMGFIAPIKAGDSFLTNSEVWNDFVDDLNVDIEDYGAWIESIGGTVSIDLAEKITKGWNVEGYAQYKISERFDLRGGVGFLTGMKSDFGTDATFSDPWLGDVTEKLTGSVSTSCIFLSLEPVMTLPMGRNFEVTFGGGPGYYMAKSSFSFKEEVSDSSDILWEWTIDTPLSGSKIGFRGFLGGEYSTGRLTIGAQLGYMSTGEIETTGEATIREDGVVLDTEEITGILDFSGLYILFGIGIPV